MIDSSTPLSSSTVDPKSVLQPFLQHNFSSYNVLICTPCFANSLNMGYFHSILQLKDIFTQYGIRHEIATIGNESLITRARNYFVSLILSKPEFTHLMFIDSDISFHPLSILRMLSFQKAIIGGAYPKKGILWDKIKNSLLQNAFMSPTELETSNYEYAINLVSARLPPSSSPSSSSSSSTSPSVSIQPPAPIPSSSSSSSSSVTTVYIENGFMNVSYVATGFMLIHRSVFESMMEKLPHLQFVNDVGAYDQGFNQKFFYAFFDCIIESKSRRYLSEDYSFCDRWIEIGGDIWLDTLCKLNHTGSYEFKGNIMDQLKARMVPKDRLS